MRFPGVPGPRDLLAVAERTGDLVERLVGALPRLTQLLDAAERIVAEIDGMVARIEETRAAADAVLARADAAADSTSRLMARVDGTATGADALVVTATATLARVADLMDRLEPSLDALQPTLTRLAETTDPREVDALVSLIDKLPVLADQVERDVMPVMRTLATVSPDLHDLLDTSRELNEMLAKLPGMGRIRRRVDAQQAGELPG